MSTYVMSDIHGCIKAYHQMLKKIAFMPDDHLYIIGDVIDRGNEGVNVLLDIMARNNVTMLLGNHEMMMMEALVAMSDPANSESCPELDAWAINGCMPTLNQLDTLSDDQFSRMMDYLSHLKARLDIEVGGRKFHLVHGAPGGKNATDRELVWTRVEKDDPPFYSDRTVISGHTPTIYYNDGNKTDISLGYAVIVIDCGCFIERIPGRLGCLRLDDMQEFYTSEWE